MATHTEAARPGLVYYSRLLALSTQVLSIFAAKTSAQTVGSEISVKSADWLLYYVIRICCVIVIHVSGLPC